MIIKEIFIVPLTKYQSTGHKKPTKTKTKKHTFFPSL